MQVALGLLKQRLPQDADICRPLKNVVLHQQRERITRHHVWTDSGGDCQVWSLSSKIFVKRRRA